MFRFWTKSLGRVGKSEAHVYFLALTCSDAEQLGKPFLLKGNFIFLLNNRNQITIIWICNNIIIWTASSEFGTNRLCEQRRFRRACASAQSRQNLRCSLIQAVNQEEPSDRKPDPWPLWMAGHAQLQFVMTECSKTQIRLTGLNYECLLSILFVPTCTIM